MRYEQPTRKIRSTARNYALRAYRLPYEESIRIGEDDEPKEEAYPINSVPERMVRPVALVYSMKEERR